MPVHVSNTVRTIETALSPAATWQWGQRLLIGILCCGLLLVTLVAWWAPEYIPLVPALLIGLTAAWYTLQKPLANLCTVLALFVLVADYEEGIQITEVLYGLYYLGFLAYWFGARTFLYRERILHDPEDKALFLFLVLITAYVPLTVLLGGRMTGLLSEWTALSMLAFYFPVKEACVRYRSGTRIMLLVVAWIFLFAAGRNLLIYQQILSGAIQFWQVEKGRVITNDGLLMTASLGSLAFLIFARKGWQQIVLLGLFLIFAISLILTQSRAFWVAFLVGALVLFLLVDRRYKGRLAILAVSGVTGVAVIGLVFFSDLLPIIIGGLVARFSSLSTAASSDISLVNRFYETAAVWEYIKVNPIVGHGMGYPYPFFSAIEKYTRYDAFIHNGYISLWYKFGIAGLALMLFAWARTAWKGVMAFRQDHATVTVRVGGLAAAISLIAYTLPANTSNPFFLSDATLLFALLMGIAGGTYRRARLDAESAAAREKAGIQSSHPD